MPVSTQAEVPVLVNRSEVSTPCIEASPPATLIRSCFTVQRASFVAPEDEAPDDAAVDCVPTDEEAAAPEAPEAPEPAADPGSAVAVAVFVVVGCEPPLSGEVPEAVTVAVRVDLLAAAPPESPDPHAASPTAANPATAMIRPAFGEFFISSVLPWIPLARRPHRRTN